MTFWDVQVYTLKSLHALGIQYRLPDRIPLFQVWVTLNKLESNPEIPKDLLAQARDALSGLMYFRQNEAEPPHKDGVYITAAV